MTQKRNNKRKDADMATAKAKAKASDKKSDKDDEAAAFLQELEKKKEANPDACLFC